MGASYKTTTFFFLNPAVVPKNVPLLFHFKPGSDSVAKADLELEAILLPKPPKCWRYSLEPTLPNPPCGWGLIAEEESAWASHCYWNK